jgi:hypothetical protein
VKVESWLLQWATSHQLRIPRHDWPEVGTEAGEAFWGALRSLFIRNGVTRDDATEASIFISGSPPKWLSEHHEVILSAVKLVRAPVVPPAPPPPQTVRPEHRPGPWDAIETVQDLKDFCRPLGPIATRISGMPRRGRQPLARLATEADDEGSDA